MRRACPLLSAFAIRRRYLTYIRTHEGWLYLAVVLDLWSRMVVGWSMSQRIDTRLVLEH